MWNHHGVWADLVDIITMEATHVVSDKRVFEASRLWL
jgi:hypothetical protein